VSTGAAGDGAVVPEAPRAVSDRRAESPFRTIHADAWADPVDVSSINKVASDLVLQRIEEVRRAGARGSDKLSSTCVLLLGPAGAGKTHLFARLRKQVRGPAVFIHTRPQIGVEPTPRFVLASIVDSLKQPVLGDEHLQLEVVAGAILAAHEGFDARFPLVKVDDARRLGDEDRRALVERVVAAVEDRFPEIAPEYLERLLAVPFAGRQDRRALLAWLSGREPSVVDLERVGAAGPLADMDVMRALSTLGVAAAYGAPVVLVFDQLENLAEDGGRTGRIHAHARLVSDLRDTVRGLCIVQMALDAEWVTRIHPALHASDRDRLEETVCALSLPDKAERRALVERWREALPEEERARPFPYPFRAAEVDGWIHEQGITPRMLMQACGEAYLRIDDAEAAEAPQVAVVDPGERLAAQWEEALVRARRDIDEAASQQRGVPAERLAGGFATALGLLGAEVSPLPAKTGPKLRVAGPAVEILIWQHGHPRSLAAAVRGASASAPGQRVLAVRERALSIPPTWKEVERELSAFTAAPHAAFVLLDRADVARLLALEAFVTAARSHDLSADDGRPVPPDTVLGWAAGALDCAGWVALEVVFASPAAADPTSAPTPAVSPAGAVRTPARPEAPATKGGRTPATAVVGPARAVLERLRVASVERLVREAKLLDPTLTRAAIVGELRRLPVRFYGESIVALAEPRS
jgi:hypothetical protein